MRNNSRAPASLMTETSFFSQHVIPCEVGTSKIESKPNQSPSNSEMR